MTGRLFLDPYHEGNVDKCRIRGHLRPTDGNQSNSDMIHIGILSGPGAQRADAQPSTRKVIHKT